MLPSASGGYTRLTEGPPWPIVVRAELAAPKDGREDRRRALAVIAHLTDVHVIDAQSPGRVEFTDRFGPPFESAFRAQETLTTQVGTAMIRRLNEIGAGPVTGRPFDVTVSTGDNIDNQQLNEMEWFFALLDGGTLTPDSGALGTYEGVQDAVSPDLHYWHPEPGVSDQYKSAGFPDYPGLLDAAITSITSPGVRTPWYSTYGNHDGLVQGNVNGWLPGGLKPLDLLLTGSVKPINLSAVLSPADLAALAANPALLTSYLTSQLSGGGLPVRVVTADPGRSVVSPAEWAQRHLASPATPGPVGHGYTEANVAEATLHYTFPVAPGVLGISLDTVNRGGYADGSLSASQLAWLEQRLIEAHARYYDAAGSVVATGHADQVVVLFSHHNVFTLGNPIPDPAEPTSPRVLWPEIQALLTRFPNVVAWVNGHSHLNRVTPVGDASGRTGGFWEISTAAHVDWPEHARIVEIVDNADGTMSIFATIVDHDGPPAVGDDEWLSSDPDTRLLALASISRELSVNDPQTNIAGKLGGPQDLNVELVLTAPFVLAPPVALTTTTTTAATGGTDRTPPTGPPVPATAALAAGGAAVATALALRRRLDAG